MSTNIVKITKNNVSLYATRYCGAKKESDDRARINLSLINGRSIDLTRNEWAAVIQAVDKAFTEFPES